MHSEEHNEHEGIEDQKIQADTAQPDIEGGFYSDLTRKDLIDGEEEESSE